MTDRNITVRLRAEVKDFKRQMDEAAKATDKTSSAFDKNGQKIQTTSGRLVRSAEVEREAWNTAGAAITAFGAAGVAALGLSANAAVNWETAWTGVTKTVDGTGDQLERLEESLRSMAFEVSASQTEIAGVAEAAGQLGVGVDNIAEFTRVMIDLGETTNLTSDEAATNLARMANIMGTSAGDVDRMGATIVDLGNNAATTESEIVEMSLRLAAAGKQAGLSEANVFAMASALTSVGVSAQAGGTALSKVMTSISDAVKDGGDNLAVFADVAGVSVEQFSTTFAQDGASAVGMFIDGLGEMSNAGESTSQVFADLGLQDEELKRATLSLGSATGLLGEQLDTANEAWGANSALVEEAAKRYDTTEAKMQIAKNAMNDAAITIGENLLPAIAGAAEGIAAMAEWFGNLDEPAQRAITGIGGVVSVTALAAGGLVLLTPRLIETYQAMQTMKNATGPLATGLKGVGASAGIAAVSIGVLAGIKEGILAVSDATREMADVRNNLAGIGEGTSGLTDHLEDLANSGRTFGESMEDLGRISDRRAELGKTWWNVFTLIQDGALVATQGIDDAAQDLAQYDQALGEFASIDTEAVVEKFVNLGKSMGAVTDNDFQLLLDQMPEYRAALLDAATAAGESLDETQLLALAMGDYTLATSDAALVTGENTDALDEMKTAGDELKETLGEVIARQRELAGVGIDERSARSAYEAALDDAVASIDENGKTLDLDTEKGRRNNAAITDIANTTWDLVEAMEAGGSSRMELTDAMDAGRDSFIETATAMGETKAEAEALADAYGLIPAVIETAVSLTGYDETYDSLQSIQTELREISGVANLRIAMGRGGSGGTTAYATGGPIVGPGTGTSDDVPIWASNGEYMQTAAAHSFWGTRAMDAMNDRDVSGLWRELGARGFRDGGAISAPVAPQVVTVPVEYRREEHAPLHMTFHGASAFSEAMDYAERRQQSILGG